MNKILLTAALALTLTTSVYAEQFTNSDNDLFNPNIDETFRSNVNSGAADIKDTRTKEEKAAGTPMPINMTAEHADYDSVSGDFHVTGNVVITQGVEKLTTSEAYGNMKTGDVYMEKGGTIADKNQTASGKWIHYNFNNKTGEIKEISGSGIKDVYNSPHAIITPEKIVMDQGGVMQRCPAVKHPACLAVKAKTFEIYPKDKLVAKDVQVFMRGKHIYSRDRWVNRLDDGAKTRIRPTAGWEDKNSGFYLGVKLEQPISNDVSVIADVVDYSRVGFKNDYGVKYDNKIFGLKYTNGWVLDDDHWYKKQNNWRFNLKSQRIAKGLPLSYSGYFEYGLWEREKDRSRERINRSWHKEYAAYLNHDPIHFFNSKKNSLNLTVGKKWVNESLTGETRSTEMYYTTFNQIINPKWMVWTGYYHERLTSSLFDIHQPDMAHEWRMGLRFKPDRTNTFSIVNRYDTENGEQYETDYRWEHKFCCWRLEFTFEDERRNKDHNFILHYYFDNI